jgi:glutathione reductase (NADPH)
LIGLGWEIGCVPKKICWHAADLLEKMRQASSYGFKFEGGKVPEFDWFAFKQKRDAYIRRLNGIYTTNLIKDKVDYIHGFARLAGPHEVEVSESGAAFGTDSGSARRTLSAEHICIAVGGRPNKSPTVGAELGIDSDGFFDLEELPKKAVIVGAGYIAIEVRLFIR